MENYMPVLILNTFSEICERYIRNSLISFINKCLLEFVAAFRKSYIVSHVFIWLGEITGKKLLDNKKYVRAILMDLYKAFDCVPHESLIAKSGCLWR